MYEDGEHRGGLLSWGQAGHAEECAFWKSLEFTTKNHTSRTPSFRGLRKWARGQAVRTRERPLSPRTVPARTHASGLWRRGVRGAERTPPRSPAGAPVRSPSTLMNPLTRGCYCLLNFKIFRFTPFDRSHPRRLAAHASLSVSTRCFSSPKTPRVVGVFF